MAMLPTMPERSGYRPEAPARKLLRSAAGRAVIRRRGARPVRVVEVPVEERPPIISEYLRRGAERGGAKAAAKQARYYFGVNADPSLEEIRAVADYYPVFRVVYASAG